MNKLLPTLLCFLLIITQALSGPFVLATCCATCCGAHLFIPILGAVGAGGCLPLCLSTGGTLPPQCAFCIAGLVAPTPWRITENSHLDSLCYIILKIRTIYLFHVLQIFKYLIVRNKLHTTNQKIIYEVSSRIFQSSLHEFTNDFAGFRASDINDSY